MAVARSDCVGLDAAPMDEGEIVACVGDVFFPIPQEAQRADEDKEDGPRKTR
jgi:hypothetical protein